MTNNIDYSNVDIPNDKSPENYHYTERRAEILQLIFNAGSPSRISQTGLAKRYGVTQGQISQDVDALGDFVDEALGQRAKLTTRAAFERVIDDLLEEDDWRAKKAAWDIVMDWSEWLADRGALDREPRRSELDVDMRSRHAEVAYQVVREGDDEPLPTTDEGGEERVDYEELGFTSGPAEIPVDAAEERGERDE